MLQLRVLPMLVTILQALGLLAGVGGIIASLLLFHSSQLLYAAARYDYHPLGELRKQREAASLETASVWVLLFSVAVLVAVLALKYLL